MEPIHELSDTGENASVNTVVDRWFHPYYDSDMVIISHTANNEITHKLVIEGDNEYPELTLDVSPEYAVVKEVFDSEVSRVETGYAMIKAKYPLW